MQKQNRGKCLVTPDWRNLLTRQESEQMMQLGLIHVDGDKLTGESKYTGDKW